MFRRLQTLLFAAALVLGAGTACAIEGDQPGIFAFGGIGFAGATSPGELKFTAIMTSDDPEAGFRQWFQEGGNVGKAYAMVACYYLDATRYEWMKERFAEAHLQVPTMRGCILYNINHEQLTENIEGGQYDAVVKPLLPEDARARHFPDPWESAFVLSPAGTSPSAASEQAFRDLLASNTPMDALQAWAKDGSPVERAYALSAYYYLSNYAYRKLKQELASDTTTFMVYRGDAGQAVNAGDFIALLEAGEFEQEITPLLWNRPPAVSAEATADAVTFFAIGGVFFSGGTSISEMILRDILTSDERLALLEDWYANGNPSQRAYAVVAFYYLDPERYQQAKEALIDDPTTFTWQRECIPFTTTYAQLFEAAEADRFKKLKPYLDPAYEDNRPDYRFCFGGITDLRLRPGEVKFREILASDDPIGGFSAWYKDGTAAEKAYSMIGLYYLAPERYAALKPTLREKYDYFRRYRGIQEYVDNILSLTALIERGAFDPYVGPLLPEDARARHFPQGQADAFTLGPSGEIQSVSPNQQAFEEIFRSANPKSALDNWANQGSPVQKAYALTGYYYLSPLSYIQLKEALKDDTTVFMTYSGCCARAVNYGQFIQMLESGQYDPYVKPLLINPTDSASVPPQGDRAALFPAGDDMPAPTPPPPLPDASMPPVSDPTSPQ
jgi:hypothetical protein